MKFAHKHKMLCCLLCMLPAMLLKGQENIGMATGNYAGIAGLWFNPANIADSRYKFDINLIGLSSYFNNNYLLVKNDAILRRKIFKDPYNSSFDAVKRDLIEEVWPVNGKVNGVVQTTIQLPVSFMVSTGKRSAIAVNLVNRYVNRVDSMPAELARLFYYELDAPEYFNQTIRADSLRYDFLNWQEVSFTYSRVLLATPNNMLKVGVTLKWLGANAGGYIHTDNAQVSFANNSTMSLQSPLIKYARTESADIGVFKRTNGFQKLEDQAFGWDAGFVYEFRTKIKKFKYVDENLEEQVRRDKNKYMFRIGVSLVDAGRFTMNRLPLTNDHSADIVNWDFSGLGITNLTQWDSAYSKMVDYIPNSPTTFRYRLPTAVIANFDLHLFGGFYANIAAKAPFKDIYAEADASVPVNKWIAVTPRFESKFFSLYVPVSKINKQTRIGATVKIGPFYAGSNNLYQLMTNKSNYQGDFHAGMRLSIPYGRPSRFIKNMSNVINDEAVDNIAKNQKEIDSLKTQMIKLQQALSDSLMRQRFQVVIYNNGSVGSAQAFQDSIVVANRPTYSSEDILTSGQRQDVKSFTDGKGKIEDSLIQELAKANIRAAELQEEVNNPRKGKKSGKSGRNTSNSSDEKMAKELERIRKQMAIQNAAIIGGGTVAAIAATSKKDEKAKPDTVTVSRDSAAMAGTDSTLRARVDTVYVKDTAGLAYRNVSEIQFDPIYFESGSSTISTSDAVRLRSLASQIRFDETLFVEIVGMTDASGSVEANRRLAYKRADAAASILARNGIRDNRIILRANIIAEVSPGNAEQARKLTIRIIDSK